VNGRRTDELLGGHLELGRVQDERARLRAADAAVERDQLLEGAARVERRVVEAPEVTPVGRLVAALVMLLGIGSSR